MLSKSCEYGIRAATYIAALDLVPDDYVGIRKISEDLDISFHFLTKILQDYTRAGFLKSYRGPSGGVALSRDPKEITVLELIECIDSDAMFSSCILGLPECGSATPCPLHDSWSAR